MQRVHIIGIGGSGLSAIAVVLLEKGWNVSGSDRQSSIMTRLLQEKGAQINIGHAPGNVQDADFVLRSSAVHDNNVEVQAAEKAGIPVLNRKEFLPLLLSGKECIAVSGTHGKTTTTAMLAWMLVYLGFDPTYVIGGTSSNLGGNAHAGQGSYFVIEADEYDHMFLGLTPWIAVVTNVEHDHPDCYPTPEDFRLAFIEFIRQIVPGGILIVCSDNPGSYSLLSALDGNLPVGRTYGLEDSKSDYQAVNLAVNATGSYSFDFLIKSSGLFQSVNLQVPGVHNVLNALAVLAVADRLSIPILDVAAALKEFKGVNRRFEVIGEKSGITIIDDYAHHPTEIRATLAAAKLKYSDRRLWAVWQPHTYSRTQFLIHGFIQAFDLADRVLVIEIYASREAMPANGFSSCQVVEQMKEARKGDEKSVGYAGDLDQAAELLMAELRYGDVVLMLSAGDADKLSLQLLADLDLSGRKE